MCFFLLSASASVCTIPSKSRPLPFSISIWHSFTASGFYVFAFFGRTIFSILCPCVFFSTLYLSHFLLHSSILFLSCWFLQFHCNRMFARILFALHLFDPHQLFTFSLFDYPFAYILVGSRCRTFAIDIERLSHCMQSSFAFGTRHCRKEKAQKLRHSHTPRRGETGRWTKRKWIHHVSESA